MSKKTCLVTGANAGIGRAAAEQLARAGLHVIMGCRSQQRGEAALAEVRQASGSDAVELLLVDMSLQRSIRRAAAQLLQRHPVLDVVIHNAASFDVGVKERRVTDEGVEQTWATNHLGPVLLTDLLMPALQRAEQGRVILVASKGLVAFPRLKVDLDDPEFQRRPFRVQKAYYQSKLAQVAYLLDLAEQLRDSTVTVHGVRVTNVRVDLDRFPDLHPVMKWIYGLKSSFSITPQEMARTYTWLATDEAAGRSTGGYWDGVDRPAPLSRFAADPAHRAAIMDLTRHSLGTAP